MLRTKAKQKQNAYKEGTWRIQTGSRRFMLFPQNNEEHVRYRQVTHPQIMLSLQHHRRV